MQTSFFVFFPQSNGCNYLKNPQVVQDAAARLLTGARKREHILPILLSLHWRSVYFKTLLLSCNNLAPAYLSELLHPDAPACCLRFTYQMPLEVSRTKWNLRRD